MNWEPTASGLTVNSDKGWAPLHLQEPQVPQHLFKFCGMWRPAEQTQYLFLGCDPLLVPLPPGRVVDVEERFVTCGDSARSEELRTETGFNPGTSVWPQLLCELSPVTGLSSVFCRTRRLLCPNPRNGSTCRYTENKRKTRFFCLIDLLPPAGSKPLLQQNNIDW